MTAIAATATRKPKSGDVAYARELAAAGCGPAEIVRHLSRRGVRISRFAVSRWINPEQHAKHLAQTRDWNRQKRAGQIKPRLQGLSVDARMERLRIYSAAGISRSAIAKFIALEHGTTLTQDEVRHALVTGRPPRKWREEASA